MINPGAEGDADRDLDGGEVIYRDPAERKRGNWQTAAVKN